MRITHLPVDQHAFLSTLDGKTITDNDLVGLEEDIHSFFREETITVFHFLNETFTIEIARQLKTTQVNKNRPDERRILLVNFSSITLEAQNALLKVLEEPTERTHLIFLIPHSQILLPTIRSRCREIDITIEEDEVVFDHFLSRSFKERLEKTAEILKDRSQISAFFLNLEKEISAERKYIRAPSIDYKKFIDYKRRALSGTPATKYILEELALTLPVVNHS
ncbi:MAG: hypothetical protein U5L75_00980 [Candidatus Campbellbacteria bacterium]|nr:hypothetical protein [Candidatus Campbellbacteria bacterium]